MLTIAFAIIVTAIIIEAVVYVFPTKAQTANDIDMCD